MKKRKLNKKGILFICIILFIIVFILLKLLVFNAPYVGKIVNGKAEYIDRIASVSRGVNDNKIIEFTNNYKLIDNCIVTINDYNNLKDKKYTMTLDDYLKNDSISNKEIYNIKKSIELNIVNSKSKYEDYLTYTCGFNNKKELLNYMDAVYKLMKKEEK